MLTAATSERIRKALEQRSVEAVPVLMYWEELRDLNNLLSRPKFVQVTVDHAQDSLFALDTLGRVWRFHPSGWVPLTTERSEA